MDYHIHMILYIRVRLISFGLVIPKHLYIKIHVLLVVVLLEIVDVGYVLILFLGGGKGGVKKIDIYTAKAY